MVNSWQQLAALGYGQFAANDFRAGIDMSSGEQNCDAELYYSAADTRIYGTTGSGHAEMNALEAFLKNACQYNAATFGNSFPISIFCEEKPCCYYCSAMMGLLGISARTSNTRKVGTRMGSTQWGGLSYTSLDFVAVLINQPRRYLNDWDST
jgi:hypothetical protein